MTNGHYCNIISIIFKEGVMIMIMIVGKWNYETRDYDPYRIPEDWHTPLYSDDMDEKVNCCQCGEIVRFGDTYTSQEIHNRLGFGFNVCEDCHEREIERRRSYVR